MDKRAATLILEVLDEIKFSEEFTKTFYRNFFTARPDLKKFFNNAEDQQKKLFVTIELMSNIVYHPDKAKDSLKDLGDRHKQYGIGPEYISIFREVFLSTLCEELGDKCTLEIKTAWKLWLNEITTMMFPED